MRHSLKLALVSSLVLLYSVGITFTENSSVAQSTKNKMCIVYDIGGRGDLSFNDMAALGGESVVKAGIAAQVVEAQSKSESDYLPNLRSLSRAGDCILIVAVGFLLTDAAKAVADEFPKQNYAIVDGFLDTKKNVLSVLFKENEGSALVGALAGLIAMENKASAVGVILGLEIPVLWKFEIGYKWGVRWARDVLRAALGNPQLAGAKVLWTYTGSFNDPARGKNATEVQLNQGAIAVYNVAGATGLGIFEAAEAKGKSAGKELGPPFGIGVDADQDYLKPGFIIASMIKRVDQGVFTAAKLAKEGSFRGGTLELGLKENGVSMSRLEDLETFLQLGIKAGAVKADQHDAIVKKVKAMRDSLPTYIWAAVSVLEQLIRSGKVQVPKVTTQDDLKKWRAELDK
ncbi:BMP family ABC transporter substrate-binding protein [Candidatus Acetothermia bacterium]|nr:BMP family ABC transporter substrate-binding protein [Candidatus Acetothermia bacterium]